MSAFRVYSILVIGLSAAWSITFGLADWQSMIKRYNPTCNYSQCIERDALYWKNINPDNDPCENFFGYACGNWKLYNPIPNYDVQWTVSHTVTLATHVEVQRLLEDKTLIRNNPELSQATWIYELCSNMPSLGRENANFLKNFTENIYWPMFLPDNEQEIQVSQSPWWIIDKHYFGIAGESAFFDIFVMDNPHNNSTAMFEVKSLYSPYGTIIHSIDWKQSEYSNYLKYLINLVRMYAPNSTSQDSIKKSLEDVIKFRQKLAKIIQKVTYEKYNLITIKEFQAWYNKFEKKNLSNHKNDWLLIIHSIIETNWNTFIEESVVVQKPYFVELVQQLQRTSEDILVNHIHIYFLERHTVLTAKMKKILDNVFYRDLEIVGEIRHDPSRWHICAESALGKMYVKVHFTTEMQKQVERMTKNIQDTIEEQISGSTWLDMKDKIWIRSKINSTKVWVGYPPWYDDPSLRPLYHDINMNPIQSGIHLITKKNHLLINAAALQSPMYDLKMPYVVNYGSMGLIIAHELYHSFDENGISYDSTGKLKQPGVEMLQKYKQQQKCFVDQHSNLCTQGLRSSSKKAKVQCNTFTYNENLADIMGAKAAYQAYKIMSLNNKDCSVLPNFSNCEKLFFISLANTLCGVVSPDYIQQYMQYAKHSMPEWRLNGIVSNMPEFSKAFQCSQKSPMNVAKHCDLWQ